MLPTFTAKLGRNGDSMCFRFLVDCGSQESYLSGSAAQKLGALLAHSNDLNITTFLERGNRTLSAVSLPIDLMDGLGTFDMSFWVTKEFYLEYSIANMSSALRNVSKSYQLADKYYSTSEFSDTISLDGILGIGAICHFTDLSKIKCCGGHAFLTGGKVMPIGNVENFLPHDQNVSLKSSSEGPTQSTVTVPDSVINFIVEPSAHHSDVLGSVLGDFSQIDSNLDNLFKVESLGLTDESLSNSDVEHIRKFSSAIERKDNHYMIELPWNESINEVKSNYHVAKAVLERVVCNLRSKGLYESYDAVFQQQLKDGILEQINLDTIDYSKNVWIPHRGVHKTDETSTTKTRVVLNCSFKSGNSPSLNEAAYPGVDLMQNLVKLLISSRTNNYLITADIKQAYLRIHLKLESDKNKFSVLWKNREGRLVAYRYRTLVFGFISSAFILNYVIKYHVDQYPRDSCSQILKNGFYVDNLIFTGNDPDVLKETFLTCRQRMLEGNFELRSWQSNSTELKEEFIEHSCGVTHKSEHEKILGYRFRLSSDGLSLATTSVEIPEKLTKRSVMSTLATVYDPLGLYTPVTVTGKVIVQNIWASEVGWDEEISNDIKRDSVKLFNDLSSLHTIEFERKLVSDGDSCSLIILSDASFQFYD